MLCAANKSCLDVYKRQDLLNPGDFVILVVPIDSAAPKGRLILPQQQTIRDVLEANAAAIVAVSYTHLSGFPSL